MGGERKGFQFLVFVQASYHNRVFINGLWLKAFLGAVIFFCDEFLSQMSVII